MRRITAFAFALTCFTAAAASADPLFREDFESGTSRWWTIDTGPIAVVSDSGASCTTQYQHETAPAQGGRVFLSNTIPVTAGDYCVSAWIRANSDGMPFIGVSRYDAQQNAIANNWIIGQAGYDNGLGGTAVAVTTDGAWHWYAAQLTLDATTASIGLMDELTTGGYADFDDIQVTAGACPARYVGPDQHMTCGGSTPFCTANGACGVCDSSNPAPNSTATCTTWCAADGDCSSDGSRVCDTSTSLCVAPPMTPPADMGGATPAPSPTMATGSSSATVANQVGSPTLSDTQVPMDTSPNMNAVSMGHAGCSMAPRSHDEGLAMALAALALFSLLLRRSARR